MKFSRRLLCVLAVLTSGAAFASATFNFSDAGNPSTVTAASNSCADVLAATQAFHDAVFANGGYSATSCSADPVVVGTQIFWTPYYVWTVASMTTGPAPDPLADFDPSLAGLLFEFGFSSVVFMWFVGKGARGVLKPLGLLP